MGTSYQIQLANVPSDLNLNDLAQQIQQKLDYLDQELMSTYVDESQLSRFNHSPVNENFTVAPEMLEVISLSLEIYHLSNHAFDITIGPLVDLWGFGPGGLIAEVPQPDEIEQTRKLLGSDKLIVIPESASIKKTSEIELDLSAIAKGYAVDQLVLLLKQYGLGNFLVEIGGEVFVQGTKTDHNAWTLGIEFPSMQIPRPPYQEINSRGDAIAIASSGDYRNYFEFNGEHYSHEIDPQTGRPISHDLVSVTVIAETSARADALATALMIMGPEQGFAFASREMIAVYFIIGADTEFVSRYSSEFTKYINQQEAHDKE